jgi:hypothetical protein
MDAALQARPSTRICGARSGTEAGEIRSSRGVLMYADIDPRVEAPQMVDTKRLAVVSE